MGMLCGPATVQRILSVRYNPEVLPPIVQPVSVYVVSYFTGGTVRLAPKYSNANFMMR